MKTNSLTNQEPMDWEKAFDDEFGIAKPYEPKDKNLRSLSQAFNGDEIGPYVDEALDNERALVAEGLMDLNERTKAFISKWLKRERDNGYDQGKEEIAKAYLKSNAKLLQQEREIGRKEFKDRLVKAVMGKKYHTLDALMVDLYDLIT